MSRGFFLFYGLLLSFAAVIPAQALTLYVATNGNDHWSGRLPAPAADGKGGPLATLSAAIKETRAARRSAPEGGPFNILLREGRYEITEPIVLTPEDSGASAGQPFMIAAYRNEKPILSGGRLVTGWKKAEGKAYLWRAELAEARDGKWQFHQLFVNSHRKQRARTPNTGYFQADGAYVADSPVKFKYRNVDLKKEWAGGDVELIALHKWIDLRQFIRELDEASHTATLSANIAEHVKESNARYYIENAPDALDEPGEWYLDRKTGVVTYWAQPGENLEKAEVIAPVLNSELIRFEGDFAGKKAVHDVVLRGLTLAHTDWTLPRNGYLDTQAAVHVRGDVLAEGVEDCLIEKCTFSHLGGYGLELGKGCQRWKVVGNEFVDLGAGGIRLGETAKSADAFEANFGHVVTDNHLHELGRVFSPAVGIIIFQSGRNQVAHNHIHDLYYTAISIGWNWGYQETPCRENVIEFNHLHDVGQGVLSDMGAVYTLGIQKGTIVRNNLIHDVNSDSYGGWGLYTDEGSSDILLENNVVYRCKSASFHQHYGRDNVVRNNILAFGKEHQLMRSREEAHISFVFTNNIVYFDSGDLLGSYWSNKNFQMDGNVYWDARAGASNVALKFAGVTLPEWQKRGHDAHSVVADPLFVAPEKLDFHLRRGSPALRLGFKPIDLSDVGVRKPFRSQVHDDGR